MHAHSTAEGPSRLPSGLTVVGDLASGHDLSIDGTFEGQLTLPDQDLTISASANVKGKIVARTVTITGRFEGNVAATEQVRVEANASVYAHLQTPSLVLADGAQFTGSVDPARTEAAMRVARYRQKQS